MKMLPKRFPQERRRDPKRWAEASVFDALARSRRPGAAIYEWGAPVNPHQLDFALWLTHVGRFAVEVKGGRYTLDRKGNRWLLHTERGVEAKPSPLAQVAVAAGDLRREIRRQSGRRVSVIPVVVFPSMKPDPAIQRRARRDKVQVVWGTANLPEALEALAEHLGEQHPPDPDQVCKEVRAVTVGNPPADHDQANVSTEPPVGPKACQFTNITIPHLRRLTIEPKLQLSHNANSRQAHPSQEVSRPCPPFVAPKLRRRQPPALSVRLNETAPHTVVRGF